MEPLTLEDEPLACRPEGELGLGPTLRCESDPVVDAPAAAEDAPWALPATVGLLTAPAVPVRTVSAEEEESLERAEPRRRRVAFPAAAFGFSLVCVPELWLFEAAGAWLRKVRVRGWLGCQVDCPLVDWPPIAWRLPEERFPADGVLRLIVG